ncbi:glutathione S-transferase [Marinomonas sp. M1K-6]|uniref:Glutathione S-transferase n=1 Tax=Marinomonas profundi TaxID=2726122 RepID=A0A847R9L2_9GAMM|nr:glutathione S-transferase [Marinomonas profundi]NLQ19143.1 glutathione S-transferase [Marinomonas profundi]UDV02050.1 glutathione S-transferase [Marinomonas profundi]
MRVIFTRWEVILRPVLYSFRRCPYAMRARYVIAFLGIPVHLREVVLKSKPAALLALGGRSSVPQLIDVDGVRYPESLDIIFWALSKCDHKAKFAPLWPKNSVQQNKIKAWIAYNDHTFKYWLDRYKYADRYPEYDEGYYRARGEVFLQRLERRLNKKTFLLGERESLADMAIFPFIRQFAAVNQVWFDASQYPSVKSWLDGFIRSEIFQSVVMVKYPVWQAGQGEVSFPA